MPLRSDAWKCNGCGWTNVGFVRECDGCGEDQDTARLSRAELVATLRVQRAQNAPGAAHSHPSPE